jgi:hypothetical protein
MSHHHLQLRHVRRTQPSQRRSSEMKTITGRWVTLPTARTAQAVTCWNRPPHGRVSRDICGGVEIEALPTPATSATTFLEQEDEGRNRAEAVVAILNELIPMCGGIAVEESSASHLLGTVKATLVIASSDVPLGVLPNWSEPASPSRTRPRTAALESYVCKRTPRSSCTPCRAGTRRSRTFARSNKWVAYAGVSRAGRLINALHARHCLQHGSPPDHLGGLVAFRSSTSRR